jgi:hypothetical protein
VIYAKGSSVFTFVQEVSQALGTQKINVHIVPQDLEGSFLPKYSFQKRKPPTLDDLPTNAKTIPSCQVNFLQGGI